MTRDRSRFTERIRGFLECRPVEHNVLATVLSTVQPARESDPPTLFAWVEAGGEVLGVALRTPPWRLLVSTMDAEAADALVPKLLEVDPELPGVNGPQPAASYLARAWRHHTGGKVETGMSQAIYWLEQVSEPARRPAGHLEVARRSERDLLLEWTYAFNHDVDAPAVQVEAEVEGRLQDARLFVWRCQGRAVSMVGTHPPVGGVVRIGPVYTPPRQRRNGYATALVADVSRRVLAAGAEKCMLYADLANATSNDIYQAVGYRRSTDAQEYRFHSAGEAQAERY